MCAHKSCSVGVCEADEIPQPWVSAESQKQCAAGRQPAADVYAEAGSSNSSSCESGEGPNTMVNKEVEPSFQAALLNLKGWRGFNNPWMAEGEDNEEYEYINLLENPERYTGYQVSKPVKIEARLQLNKLPCLSFLVPK